MEMSAMIKPRPEDLDDLFSLKGKNAVVVGGGGGIGRGLAGGLLRYGAEVAIADINLSALESAVEDLKDWSDKPVRSYRVDTGQESSVEELVANAAADMGGRIHILINAQGFNVKAPATEFPLADWDKLFAVNVRGVMVCCKNFARHMVEQGGGKIINLSSIRGARAALGGNLAYCSSKGAIDMMTKQLAVELASKRVLVNAIAPIITITPMTEERVRREADRYEKMLVNIPMGRMGTVADLVGPAIFLASAASDFVTGTILYPDGGTMAFV
jgi:NAD(P)-dependent dehydrogenase (short-subunit alcohol dehydrogenase family)